MIENSTISAEEQFENQERTHSTETQDSGSETNETPENLIEDSYPVENRTSDPENLGPDPDLISTEVPSPEDETISETTPSKFIEDEMIVEPEDTEKMKESDVLEDVRSEMNSEASKESEEMAIPVLDSDPGQVVESSSIETDKYQPENTKTMDQVQAESEVVISGLATENQSEEILVVDDHEMEAMETKDSEETNEDYSSFDKEQLVKIVEQLNREGDPNAAHRGVQKIKPIFDALYQKDKAEALEKFVADGGDANSFEFKHHYLEVHFNQAVKGIYEKRKLNQDFQTKEKAKNLETKLNLLEQLRQLVDDHEHTPGYDKFKTIREDWKKIGPVGPEHAQNLNASYYSLIERFYSLSEIYHNLRDFDRKKNLEMKLELISKIEKLADEPMISKAMKDLMTYQDEFRSLGPIQKDNFEAVRERMKLAVDTLYERRRAFNEERKQLVAEEVTLKEQILQRVNEFENFVTNSAKEWQSKTKELLALQEEWKLIPTRFREKTGDLNKQFWTVYKKFMHNKNEFYKELDKGKKEIIAQKQALVDEVNSLKDGDDFDGIANRMKELQIEWKKVAPIFGKEGQKLYEGFKAGLDHFFGRLREQRSGEDKIQSENLAAKDAICVEIEALAASGKGTADLVESLREKFRNTGFVPIKTIQKINGRFSKAMIEMIDKSDSISANEKERMKISVLSNKSTYSIEGVKALKNQEGYIQKRLQQLRKDVGNLEDNVSMFKMSKNAMAMIEDIQKRINLSKLEIKELESQLKEIRQGDKS